MQEESDNSQRPEASATAPAGQQDSALEQAEFVHREVCYRCHKPAALCVCEGLTKVKNRTRILILQHPRERFHPIGTARFAELGLANVSAEISWSETGRSIRRELEVEPGTGLLYPHPNAKLLSELPLAERPSQLIVLDGTWHHAHTIYRENPWLHALPHYALRPEEPSRYRIRKEPRAECVSTLEAITQALQQLEPELEGLEGLLGSFDQMIDQQIAYAKKGGGRRRKRKRNKASRAIPRALLEQYPRLVVVCGEASAPPPELMCAKAVPPGWKNQLLYWVACRPATGEVFKSLVRPREPVADQHLEHLELERESFADAPDLSEMLSAWNTFTRPGDVFAAWNQSTWDILHEASVDAGTLSPLAKGADATQPKGPQQQVGFVLLKAVYFNVHRDAPRGDLEQILEREGLATTDLGLAGRAGRRLGNALSILEFLRHGSEPGASAEG
ncbi:MAG: DTW domain-containing protein [Polyangiaceae bacterium]|nr:DTW domain-containing protein [Polyangiaceae bacterium]MCB9605788.1 DTW domain-containing protein [Polyangiaceae bacterium]